MKVVCGRVEKGEFGGKCREQMVNVWLGTDGKCMGGNR